MTNLQRRIIAELRAESDLVPSAVPGPTPRKRSRWARYSLAAATMVILVFGTLWLVNRPTVPVESSVTITSVSGASDPEVVELWADWWRAYAEVRETASASEDGFGFDPTPLEEFATDRDAAFQVTELLFTVEVGGGPVEVGGPSEIRLAPHIELAGDRATIRDCVYMDPIPWPGLRRDESTAGTVVMIAEAEATPQGWRISEFEPEFIGQQMASEPCQPGQP